MKRKVKMRSSLEGQSRERINLRVSSDDKDLFASASAKKGWTLTHFAKRAMRRYARKILKPRRLSDADRDLFLKAVDGELPIRDALQEAFAPVLEPRPSSQHGE